MKKIYLIFILLVAMACSKQQAMHPLEESGVSEERSFNPAYWANFPGGKQVNDIARLNGKLWLATQGNLVAFDPEQSGMQFYNQGNSGMPSSGVSTIFPDSASGLWTSFDNYYKITRFLPDAKKKKKWTIYRETETRFSGNTIEHFAHAPNGGIWAGHRSRLAYISPEKKITVFNFSHEAFKKRDMPGTGSISALASGKQGKLWITTLSSHLVRYNRQTNDWQVQRIGGDENKRFRVKQMLVTPANTLWMAAEQGILRFKNGKWKLFDRTSIQAPGYESRERNQSALRTHAIDQASEQKLYAASEHGILHWHQNEWKFLSDFELVPEGKITSLLAEKNQLWIGTNAGGLIEMTPSNQFKGKALQYPGGRRQWNIRLHNCSPVHLSMNRISLIRPAPDGALWVTNDGPSDYGTIYFHPKKGEVKRYTEKHGLLRDKSLLDIAFSPSGEAWLATSNGLMQQKAKNQWKTYTPDNSGLPDEATDIVIAKDGKVYAGTNKGLAIFNGQEWQTDIPGMNVNDLAMGPDGSLWVMSAAEVARYDGNEWQVFDPKDGDINPGNGLKCIYVDKAGQAWVGLDAIHRNGLARVSPQGNWQSFSKAPGRTVYDLAEDTDGNLWMVSWKGGLCRYFPDKSGRDAWKSYGPNNSALPNPHTIAMAIDNQGTIWIGNREGGLTAFNPEGIPF